jgi:hypothetical protein
MGPPLGFALHGVAGGSPVEGLNEGETAVQVGFGGGEGLRLQGVGELLPEGREQISGFPTQQALGGRRDVSRNSNS